MTCSLMSGRVIACSDLKTLRVEVQRTIKHAKYHKIIRSSRIYLVHVEGLVVNVGDHVMIRSSRPISRKKHWVCVQSRSKNDMNVKELRNDTSSN